MSEPSTATAASAIAIKSLMRPILTALAGGVLGFGAAKFAGTHESPKATPTTTVTTNVAAPAQRLQILTLMECQYWVSENPFFMLHLPKCTNHPAGK